MLPIPDLSDDDKARFWKKVNKTRDCWIWKGVPVKYPKFSIEGRMYLATRVAWKIAYGNPGEYNVLHKCNNFLCVRPDHLRLGNMDRYFHS